MHEMQTIVSDVHGCHGLCPSVTQHLAAHTVCVGSFDAAFAKLLWPLVDYICIFAEIRKKF